MIEIDGSYKSGGGQILRTALALSALTRKPFKLEKIRQGRDIPGLKPQHLECVRAVQELCDAKVEGDKIESFFLNFIPNNILQKTIVADCKTAGSITLILQSLLLPVVLSGKEIRLKLNGGTDVPWSPSFDYFRNVILPFYKRFAVVEVELERRGFFPKGGGKVDIKIKSRYTFDNFPKMELNLVDFPKLSAIEGLSFASSSLNKADVAERQQKSARKILAELEVPVNINTEYCDTYSTGSGITLWTIHEDNKTVLGADELGEIRKRAETVGENCALKLMREISSNSPVDEHLCDNLIPFLGILGGKIKTSRISDHTLSNIYVCEKFLNVEYKIEGNIIKVSKK